MVFSQSNQPRHTRFRYVREGLGHLQQQRFARCWVSISTKHRLSCDFERVVENRVETLQQCAELDLELLLALQTTNFLLCEGKQQGKHTHTKTNKETHLGIRERISFGQQRQSNEHALDVSIRHRFVFQIRARNEF